MIHSDGISDAKFKVLKFPKISFSTRIYIYSIVQGIEQRMSVDDDVTPPPTQPSHNHVHMHGDVIHSHPHDHPHDHDHAHLPLDTQLEEKVAQVEPATEPSTDGLQFLGPAGKPKHPLHASGVCPRVAVWDLLWTHLSFWQVNIRGLIWFVGT